MGKKNTGAASVKIKPSTMKLVKIVCADNNFKIGGFVDLAVLKEVQKWTDKAVKEAR